MKRTAAVLSAFVFLTVLPFPAPAEPPAHAKAHGWRKKNDPNYVGYTGKKWAKDYGVVEGRCNAKAVGAVLGGAVGGVIGSQVGKGDDRPVAILVGTVLGAVIGSKIGAEIDSGDRGCMGHALELAGERKPVRWKNEQTGVSYTLTPTRNFKQGELPCREFTTVTSKGGKAAAPITGVACRKAAGEWEFRT
jgi:surface antigen